MHHRLSQLRSSFASPNAASISRIIWLLALLVICLQSASAQTGIWVWGYNVAGQLGDNSTTERHAPVQVLGPGGAGTLDGIISVSGGFIYSLALKSDGTVWAWGYNAYGQLGDNTFTTRATPVQVLGPGGAGTLSGVIAISARGHHSLALKSDGTVWAWGNSQQGELGNNTDTVSLTPVQVLGPGGSGFLTNIVSIS
ncbi:MAG: hypothetical protein WCB68_10375, partial [Pyrinomonadaceae bacterium]